jgi:hypothetical protein
MARTWSRVALVLLGLAAAGSAWGAPAAGPGALRVRPSRVALGLFYNGATLDVDAEVPAGYQAAVRLTGHRERLELKRRGKRVGVLWMNVGDVAFDDLPVVYHVITTAPLATLGSPAVLAKTGLGYAALVPDGAPGAPLRQELVRLKERDGLFGLREGALVPGTTAGGAAGDAAATGPVGAGGHFHGTLRLPPRAPADDYQAELFGFKGGEAVRLAATTVHLEPAGAVRAMRGLALGHGLLYGILACVIAVVVGLLTGLVFQPKADESH